MRWSAIGSDTRNKESCCRRTIPERPASSTPPVWTMIVSVRLQTETIISMAGFAVTLEYPEYRTDALRIGGDVQSELVNAAIIHRIDPAMGSTDEIMDSLWVRARLAARNNKPLIQAVAARLDHYGFWTGEDVQRIIDECEKELDH